MLSDSERKKEEHGVRSLASPGWAQASGAGHALNDLVSGTSKLLTVPSYKYAQVPEKRYIQKTHNTL
jgi:hypothetical protein